MATERRRPRRARRDHERVRNRPRGRVPRDRGRRGAFGDEGDDGERRCHSWTRSTPRAGRRLRKKRRTSTSSQRRSTGSRPRRPRATGSRPSPPGSRRTASSSSVRSSGCAGSRPALFQEVEGYFWYGAGGHDGLVQLLGRRGGGAGDRRGRAQRSTTRSLGSEQQIGSGTQVPTPRSSPTRRSSSSARASRPFSSSPRSWRASSGPSATSGGPCSQASGWRSSRVP